MSTRAESTPVIGITTAAPTALYEEQLAKYEEFIGAARSRPRRIRALDPSRRDIIVISDLHVPDERTDLLAHVAEKHRGCELVIAGDLDDFEMLSRFDHLDWTTPTLQESLAKRDALLDFLGEHFNDIAIVLGNHDLRMPRKAARALGSDYAWISQQFLLWAYEKRHGIKVVTQDVRKKSGNPIPYVHYYHQIGDCLIGHVEVSGRMQTKSVERSHDFFTAWKNELGLNPFRVVLQAHSHKQSFFRHPMTKAYCYEIGAMCDIQSYSLMSRQHYSPPQLGYFHLVQYNGVTDVNESRLYSLD